MLYILRHGDSLRQKTRKASCWPENFHCPLTSKGKKQIEKVAQFLKNKNIKIIFSSDLLRTKQTAQIIHKTTRAKIIFDKRLREFDVGEFNGKNSLLVWNYLHKSKNSLFTKLPRGESLIDLKNRINNFLIYIRKDYSKSNILVISHELPLTILEYLLKGRTLAQIMKWRSSHRNKLIKPGELRKINL